MQTGKPQI